MSRVLLQPFHELIERQRRDTSVEGLQLGDGITEKLRERHSHLRLEFAKPVIDLWVVLEENWVLELDLLAFPRRHTLDLRQLIVEHDCRDTRKHLLQMLHDPQDLFAVTDDLQQILVTDEVETRERGTFAL